MAEHNLFLYTTDDGNARFVLRELAEATVVNQKFTTASYSPRRVFHLE